MQTVFVMLTLGRLNVYSWNASRVRCHHSLLMSSCWFPSSIRHASARVSHTHSFACGLYSLKPLALFLVRTRVSRAHIPLRTTPPTHETWPARDHAGDHRTTPRAHTNSDLERSPCIVVDVYFFVSPRANVPTYGSTRSS